MLMLFFGEFKFYPTQTVLSFLSLHQVFAQNNFYEVTHTFYVNYLFS